MILTTSETGSPEVRQRPGPEVSLSDRRTAPTSSHYLELLTVSDQWTGHCWFSTAPPPHEQEPELHMGQNLPTDLPPCGLAEDHWPAASRVPQYCQDRTASWTWFKASRSDCQCPPEH